MWSTIAGEVSNRGPSKNIQNCKLKLRTLKDAYNKCKAANNNPRQSGGKLKTCPYYEELDALLSDRPCTKLTQFHEVGTSEDGVMDETSEDEILQTPARSTDEASKEAPASEQTHDRESESNLPDENVSQNTQNTLKRKLQSEEESEVDQEDDDFYDGIKENGKLMEKVRDRNKVQN